MSEPSAQGDQQDHRGAARLRLGVLDQSPIAAGCTPAQALEQSVALAALSERLGYHHYWVAEHHGSQSFAGCAPEILITRIASATSRIRVGSAGVMLMHYSPLKVAETFNLLATLFPGRIDCGIGRAPGSDGLTASALAYGNRLGHEYFPAKLLDLRAWLTGLPAYTDAFADVTPTPVPERPAAMWMLGSSLEGARIAARFGLPYSHAHFIGPDTAQAAIALYRNEFEPSDACQEPQVDLGVFVLAADSNEKAERLAACRDLWRARVERGEFRPIPTEEEAALHPWTDAERARIEERRQHQLLGTADVVAGQMHALAERCGVERMSVISITPDFADRQRCYELLAEAVLRPA